MECAILQERGDSVYAQHLIEAKKIENIFHSDFFFDFKEKFEDFENQQAKHSPFCITILDFDEIN
jgi:hypothetical protein